jgi:hypothetical protein
MSEIETTIRRHALQRLAAVFKVEIDSLSPAARFGEGLKARPASDFKANEFDIIDGDIKDVADKPLLKAMSRGELEIRTLADYCDHMVRCYATKPKDVARLLSLPPPS